MQPADTIAAQAGLIRPPIDPFTVYERWEIAGFLALLATVAAAILATVAAAILLPLAWCIKIAAVMVVIYVEAQVAARLCDRL